jgi:hypothetical protein
MIVNVTTGNGTNTVVIPNAPSLQVTVGTRYAETFARPEKTVDDTEAAVVGDQFRWIILDASINPADYQIDPSLFTGLTLYVAGGDDVTQGAWVSATTGTIKLKTGEDFDQVEVMARQPIVLYSDGTNLKEK